MSIRNVMQAKNVILNFVLATFKKVKRNMELFSVTYFIFVVNSLNPV